MSVERRKEAIFLTTLLIRMDDERPLTKAPRSAAESMKVGRMMGWCPSLSRVRRSPMSRASPSNVCGLLNDAMVG